MLPLILPENAAAPPASEPLDSRCPTNYTWAYESTNEVLSGLYERAKHEQWDGRTCLPWETSVDPSRENFPDMQIPIFGTPLWNKLSPANVRELRQHQTAWMMSQFLHGEQGALLATAQLVDAAPDIDAKLYASTQVMDEARHVEVYERYLREKVELAYPINPPLKSLIDRILTDPRWDMKYLGMQILVEGLALAAFRYMHTFTSEPLVRELTKMVMKDEARHVAFGVVSLRAYYTADFDPRERREREEFVYDACRLMRDRFLQEEVWRALGFPVAECLDLTLNSVAMMEFRRLLFARIVPNVKSLGLLSPWLRERFAELGILQFENEPADG